MISELKIGNFKSLQSVDLKLGHLNLLIGANAGGKSNFLDALRFLQGVGSGLSIGEILDGKPEMPTTARWPGIRGGSSMVAFRNREGEKADPVSFELRAIDRPKHPKDARDISYRIAFSQEVESVRIVDEEFWHGDNPAFSNQDRLHLENSRPEYLDALRALGMRERTFFSEIAKVCSNVLKRPDFPQSSDAPISMRLTTIGPEITTYLRDVILMLELLAEMQFLDPNPAQLRSYSQKVHRLGENGEGFASLIHEISKNGDKSALLEWLKELRPDEVDDIYALEGLNNDYMLAIKEGNTEYRAPVLSEGTLRFIALAAAFFQPSMPKVLVIEEIEKGLHPTRLRLLLELMRSQSKRTGTQVFATTHSPTLLAWLNPEDRKTTFVCTRDEESGATKMRSLAEVPDLEALIQKRYQVDDLFAQGWLESALHEL